jgi:hypothetical protein
MAEAGVHLPRVAARVSPAGAERGPWRDDLIAAGLAATLVFGLFLDGWNHINLQNGALGGFFTIWHGLLYAGFTATALWVVTRNPHLYGRGEAQTYYHVLLGVPLRYPLAVAGLGLATIGLIGDVGWHTAFGEEEGVARVIAPFHLLLFAGAAALVAAPLRSAWYAPEYYPRTPTFTEILPALASLTLVTAVAAFMFQWLSAFVDWTPSIQLGRVPPDLAADQRVEGTVEFAGVARVLVTSLVLTAPVLLALRRWLLPFGSVTFLFVVVATLMCALSEFDLAGSILAAFLGGLAADAAIRALHPDADSPFAFRVVAAVTPLALWTTYFLGLDAFHDIEWPLDLWLGTVGLATLASILLSFVAVPPAAPVALEAAVRGSDPGPTPPGPARRPSPRS